MSRWYKSGQELIHEIKETTLPSNMLAIWFMAQAGIVLKTGAAVIGIDLYLENRKYRAVCPPFAPSEAAYLFDYLLCTHNHLDHLDPVTVSGIAKAEDNPHTTFIVPTPWIHVTEELGVKSDHIIGAKTLQPISLPGDVTLTPIRSAHEEFETDGNGDYTCLGYLVRTPAGTLYHSGDTIEWETMTDELKPFRPDIVCLPINGSDWKRKKADIIGNLNAREAADISAETGADLLIPLHYDVFAHNGENPAYLADYMWQHYPAKKYHVMAPGERFIYMK